MRDFSFQQKKNTFFDKFIANLRYSFVYKKLLKTGLSFAAKNICDVGCGYNGNLLTFLKTKFPNNSYFGVDLCAQEDSFFKFVKANFETDIFALGDASMDIVCSLAVIEHLNSPDNYLSEIKRILKTGGTCIMTTPSVYGKPVLEFLAYSGLGTKEEILDHKIYYDKSTLEIVVSKYFQDYNVSYFQFGMNLFLIAKK